MGEYIYASFRCGGKIEGRHVPALVNRANHYGLSVDGGGGEITAADIGQQWADDEINYGNLDDLRDYCTEHGIDHEYYSASEPGRDANREKVIDGQAVSFSEGEEGAVVLIADLVKLDALASGWAKLHDQIKLWARELPPVEIVGPVPDHEEDEDAQEEDP